MYHTRETDGERKGVGCMRITGRKIRKEWKGRVQSNDKSDDGIKTKGGEGEGGNISGEE